MNIVVSMPWANYRGRKSTSSKSKGEYMVQPFENVKRRMAMMLCVLVLEETQARDGRTI